MASPDITFGPRRIDWKRHFESLEPFAQGLGGVVHVRAEKEAPTYIFANLLSNHLQQIQGAKSTAVACIGPGQPMHVALPDVVEYIARVMGLDEELQPYRTPSIGIISDIEAARDVIVRDVTVKVGGGYSIRRAVAQLCQGVKQLAPKRRLALIVQDCHLFSERDLLVLGESLWEDGLSGLIEYGLLVINLYDPDGMDGRGHAWLRRADLLLDLRARLSPDEASIACHDLEQIALSEGIFDDPGAAHAFASTVVVLSKHIVSDLHTYASRALLGLQDDSAR